MSKIKIMSRRTTSSLETTNSVLLALLPHFEKFSPA